jgi:adenine-specific DNA-methyltransferase
MLRETASPRPRRSRGASSHRAARSERGSITAVDAGTDERSPLLSLADDARHAANAALDPGRRSALGQFMTPASIASFMAAMFDLGLREVRLLDAGAGVGSLTAAFVAEACRRPRPPRSIEVTAFEVEQTMLGHLRSVLRNCRREANAAGVRFKAKVLENDFVEAASVMLDAGLFGRGERPRFHAAILNPPYRKIHSDSRERSLLRAAGIETSNLYAAFVALAIKLLEPGGELVAITPRSFCNGPYFKPFRRLLLREMVLLRVHVFEARNAAFEDDEVLQENVIFHARKTSGSRTGDHRVVGARHGRVVLSTSASPDAAVSERSVLYDSVVNPDDPNTFIHLAVSDEDERAARTIQALPCTLPELSIQVSTGRVVEFRAREFLRKNPGRKTVPLIHPAHFDQGFVSWPRANGRKPNALADVAETEDLMVASGTYVLTKRFTSKEERRRVVAAVYDPARLPPDAERVGFENHVNYFHANDGGLPKAVALGLALYLNSSLVDRYFRQFNGHTQVNAGDLRSLRYPSLDDLKAMGPSIGASFPEQEAIDEIVAGALLYARKASAR